MQLCLDEVEPKKKKMAILWIKTREELLVFALVYRGIGVFFGAYILSYSLRRWGHFCSQFFFLIEAKSLCQILQE